MSHYKNFLIRLFLAFLFGSLLLGSFIGCSVNPNKGSELKNWFDDTDQIKVLCTTAQVADLAKAVGGDHVKVLTLICGDLDPHSYELVKGDDEKIAMADVIFYNGLHLEHGASLSTLLKESVKAKAIGDEIASRHPEWILKNDCIVDPHLWMDVSIWKEGANVVLDHFQKIDPENSTKYLGNFYSYSEKLNLLHQEIIKNLQQIPSSKRYLMTSHDAFKYFVRAYLAQQTDSSWLNRFAAPEGLAPDGQLSSVDIQRMIDFVSLHRLKVIFPESNVSPDSIVKIASAAAELGFSVKVCPETLYGDSMSGLTYIDMMRENARIIAENLNE